MKTAISIPDRVFQSAEKLARRMGLSRSQLFTTAVTEYLARHQARQITERLNQVYSDEDSSVMPDLIQLQARTLSREES